jgi:hypothetical protein
MIDNITNHSSVILYIIMIDNITNHSSVKLYIVMRLVVRYVVYHYYIKCDR